MREQDEVEQERHEAATEEPATVQQHMPTKLPSGFDGVEPAPRTKANIEASIKRMREKLSKIADIALAADAKCVNIEKLGVRYLECSKALCEIRIMCGRDIAEKAGIAAGTYYSPSWLGDLAKELGEKSQSEIQREVARQKRKIHWTCYPTKVDLCVMGKTQQNGKVYEVRVNKRKVADVQDTYGQCKVNGKTVLTVSFTGGAWMLNRILTEGMQALVNYKAKKKRDIRRNYAKRDAAKKEVA